MSFLETSWIAIYNLYYKVLHIITFYNYCSWW